MRLSPAELDEALARLSDAECDELLRALQRDRREEEARQELDIRAPLAQLLKTCVEAEAAKADDPEAFIAAHTAHTASLEQHMAEQPPASDGMGVSSWMAELLKARNGARELAAKDGYPSPQWQDFVKKADPEPEELELPPDVKADIEYTKAQARAAPVRPVQPQHDRLWAFRDKSDGTTPPATWDQ